MSSEKWIAETFCKAGRADTLLGGQFGSEGKGAAAAWLAHTLVTKGRGKGYDIVTCNSGSQAGHTAIHNGRTYITRHLPTVPLIKPGSVVYLNAGSIIDPLVLEAELEHLDYLNYCSGFFIHPNAAVITPECVIAEGREDSAQTKIASTRKGVGEALSRKVLRSGIIAKDDPFLRKFVSLPLDLNRMMRNGDSILVEIPQGYGLSLNGSFYPYCTSRDCTVMQALSDAHIHPHFLGRTMLVLRAYPIRVGGTSGSCYPDQREISWEELGREPEITTVTQRVRRVFTWSGMQAYEALSASRPEVIFLTHCDYFENEADLEGAVLSIKTSAKEIGLVQPIIFCGNGPTTDDVVVWEG